MTTPDELPVVQVERLYAERETDSDELMPHYLRHVDRMTVEGLHAKSDIAAELAYRDARIAALLAERDALRESNADYRMAASAEAAEVDRRGQQIADLRAELARLREAEGALVAKWREEAEQVRRDPESFNDRWMEGYTATADELAAIAADQPGDRT